METAVMADRLGIRAAAEICKCNPVVLYVAAAKKLLPSDASTGVVTFDRQDLHRYKVSVAAERAAKEQAAQADRDRRFKQINTRKPSTGNRG
jgi:hypothetical protein